MAKESRPTARTSEKSRVRFVLDARWRNPSNGRYRTLHAGRSYELPTAVAENFVSRGAAVPAGTAELVEPAEDDADDDGGADAGPEG